MPVAPVVQPKRVSKKTTQSIDGSEIRHLVQSVFTEVLAEFRRWKAKHSEHILRSRTLRKQISPAPALDSCNTPLRVVDRNHNTDGNSNAEQRLVSMTCYSADGTPTSTSVISLQVIPAEVLEPHEPYESCSSISRNVFKGDDDDRMAFIPFADDATFDHMGHTLWYDSLAWQEDYDPDLEVVSLEAAYRLHIIHRLLYEDIDNTEVLPFKLFSSPGKPGLFTLCRRRDLLYWEGTIVPRSYNFPSPSLPSPSSHRHRLEQVNALFCPNINCIETLCAVHIEFNTMLLPRKPIVGLSELLSRVEYPCEAGCFLQTRTVEAPQWSEDDITLLKTILEIEPDMIPCNHAELCLKPCHEVLYYRKLLYPDSSEPGVEHPDEENKRKPRLVEFQDNDPLEFTPNKPCCHSGPCDALSNCPCFTNKSHCQRNCRCPAKCVRRWKGCRCARVRKGRSCVNYRRCPCVEARRECDPELCGRCGCRDIETSGCANSQIQHGHFKGLEVKKSQWGLGAFLLEPAKQGDLIVEYVGELIYEETFNSRGEVANHRRRSYVFGLDNTFSLDSSYLGNPSRFVDHAGAMSATCKILWNCRALTRLVNGEHRIGIFAMKNMDPGTEILIDYGPEFFTTHEPQQSGTLTTLA